MDFIFHLRSQFVKERTPDDACSFTFPGRNFNFDIDIECCHFQPGTEQISIARVSRAAGLSADSFLRHIIFCQMDWV